ncbi:hypothetical protein FAZ95_12785 [Trinickia violacea]|uniref:DUF4148 domain-containing protein n=1 Tax=Trinickia violacea TaxID=2571746 RepID=A0A4P8IVU3_9BURK|nr:hypothetical protein FAZ95_12785 [Trinickia violacea]
MKSMSLLLCGVVVSLATVAAHAQHAPRDWNRQSNGAPIQSLPQNDPRGPQITPTVPRGDLRGDIASNARSRAEPARGGENRRQP